MTDYLATLAEAAWALRWLFLFVGSLIWIALALVTHWHRQAARAAETQTALDLSRFDAGKFDRQNAALREWARTGRVS